MIHNIGGAYGSSRGRDPLAELACCDALPAVVRTVVKASHVQVDMADVLEGWLNQRARGMSAGDYAVLVARLLARARATDARLTYGPTHPDAGGAR